jgi:hypothetical protein
MSYNGTAVTGKARSQMPTDELPCNDVTGKARSQTPANELVQFNAVSGKEKSLMPADELQWDCCDR